MIWAKVLFILSLILDKSAVWSRIERVNYRQKEKQVLDSILGKGYDKRIRPSGGNGTGTASLPADDHYRSATKVTVNAMIRSISKIDDYKMEYSVQVTFREQWNDERLRYYDDTKGHLKYLTLTDPTKVWMPDTFFRNEKEARKHEIIVPNVYVRIFPDGEILYSIRISLTLACPMDLRLYPLDKQVCVLQIASYGWAKDDLIYQWKEKDPVQVVPGLHLPRFTLEQYKSAYCDVITNTGEYSCLKVELIFKREFSYYMITIYVPCCMLVIVSWVSFWLDQNAIPARVSLGVTTLLTMSTQTSGINAQLPPVSYTKAIDVWTGVCQGFVFCALLEFALVNYASRSDMQRERARERMERARRQWELEHADQYDPNPISTPADSTIPGHGPMPKTQAPSRRTSTAAQVLNQQSSVPGTSQSSAGTPKTSVPSTAFRGANGRIGSVSQGLSSRNSSSGNLLDMPDGIPGMAMKKRQTPTAQDIEATMREISALEGYRPTTTYPHPLSSTLEDLAYAASAAAYGSQYPQFSTLAYMNEPEAMMGGGNSRSCDLHSSYIQQQQQVPYGMGGPFGPMGLAHDFSGMPVNRMGGNTIGRGLCGGLSLVGHTCTYILCCGTRGLLSKFPSRAKRIDVISRFIFPLIFAIFNLTYWLYYLFAKSKSPQLEEEN